MTQLREGLEADDLKRLVHDELHIDEFKSKLGRDEDVVVISFKVRDKEPAHDLVNFIEKGYDWVIDADVSSGEMDDGDYIVFVECERDATITQHIIDLLADIGKLTGHDLSQWRMRYYRDHKDHPVTKDSIDALVPKTSEEYRRRFGKKELDEMRAVAGVKITTQAPVNDFTDTLRIAAGLK
jgi:translation initiation factor IF-2